MPKAGVVVVVALPKAGNGEVVAAVPKGREAGREVPKPEVWAGVEVAANREGVAVVAEGDAVVNSEEVVEGVGEGEAEPNKGVGEAEPNKEVVVLVVAGAALVEGVVGMVNPVLAPGVGVVAAADVNAAPKDDVGACGAGAAWAVVWVRHVTSDVSPPGAA